MHTSVVLYNADYRGRELAPYVCMSEHVRWKKNENSFYKIFSLWCYMLLFVIFITLLFIKFVN